MKWKTSTISDFKFSTQLISTVFLVGIIVFEVSAQCIRICLVNRFVNGLFLSLLFNLSFARIQNLQQKQVYILTTPIICRKHLP